MVEAVFGEKLADQTYIDRKGVYAIIMNEKNEVATVKLPHGYFLPGGGLEGEESKEACLRRECLEELGWEIEINEYVCQAANYHFSIYRDKYLYSTVNFYLQTKWDEVHKPINNNHK